MRRLAELARAAEQRNAPPGERNEAYAPLKAYIEFLLTRQRDALQDVGFWGGIRVARALPTPALAGTHSLYEQSQAPGFELHANREQPYGPPDDPLGRAIVVGLEPGYADDAASGDEVWPAVCDTGSLLARTMQRHLSLRRGIRDGNGARG